MVNLRVGALIFLILVGGFAVRSIRSAGTSARFALVPQPRQLETRAGNFDLTPACAIKAESSARPAAGLLADRLRCSTGFKLPVQDLEMPPGTGVIVLTSEQADPRLGDEGYTLEARPDGVVIRATTSRGFFYGTQTLLQLLPPHILARELVSGIAWKVPCVRINDQPRFRWRGFMLDVSRHFFRPAEIKELLDAMALYKLNVFHWHLTDDQGWRLEIKRYPRLTEIGAWRRRIGFNLDPQASTAYDSRGRYGGFYTQAEVRDLVAYAAARGITIVPEIELPGHSSASLAAYPELSCSGGPYTTDLAEAVAPGVYCAGKDETFEFLQNVLTEVMELFPGEFIHVGGDEVCHVNWHQCRRCQELMKREGLRTEADLRAWFVQRVETYLEAHGRRLRGWSEIQNSRLGPSAALMDWIGGGVEAASSGHDVVMSPVDYCYLDFYQSRDRSREPPAAGAFLPLEKVYRFEPMPERLPPAGQAHILGAQANLWTEYVPSLAQAEYMAFPRLIALAEVVWAPRKARDWKDFCRRLVSQEQRLSLMGVNRRIKSG